MHLSSLAHMISLVLLFGDEEHRNVSQMGECSHTLPYERGLWGPL